MTKKANSTLTIVATAALMLLSAGSALAEGVDLASQGDARENLSYAVHLEQLRVQAYNDGQAKKLAHALQTQALSTTVHVSHFRRDEEPGTRTIDSPMCFLPRFTAAEQDRCSIVGWVVRKIGGQR